MQRDFSRREEKNELRKKWSELMLRKRENEREIKAARRNLLEENEEEIFKAMLAQLEPEGLEGSTQEHERHQILVEATRLQASRIAKLNHIQNRGAMQTLAPKIKMADGINLAMALIRKGDTQVLECLRRGDFEAMLVVADIRRKFDLYKKVDEGEWGVYCRAGLPETPDFTLIGDGDSLRILAHTDGRVSLVLKDNIKNLPAGTDLTELRTDNIVEFMDFVHESGLLRDASILTAYLNSSRPGWKETSKREDAPGRPGEGAHHEDPHDVLGLDKTMTMEEISKAFIAQMQAVSGLPNAAPQRRLIAAYKAIKALHQKSD